MATKTTTFLYIVFYLQGSRRYWHMGFIFFRKYKLLLIHNNITKPFNETCLYMGFKFHQYYIILPYLYS